MHDVRASHWRMGLTSHRSSNLLSKFVRSTAMRPTFEKGRLAALGCRAPENHGMRNFDLIGNYWYLRVRRVFVALGRLSPA